MKIDRNAPLPLPLNPLVLALAFAVLTPVASLAGEICGGGIFDRFTDDFYFSASSDQGVVGDVVAVDISLTVQKPFDPSLRAMTVVGCYDESKLELLHPVQYSEYFDILAFRSLFLDLGVAPRPTREGGGLGFLLDANFDRDHVETFFGNGQTVHLMTLYFRIKEGASPGDDIEIRFCDNEFRLHTGGCVYSYVYYIPNAQDQLIAHSRLHQDGTIRVVDGPVTRPEPPELPQYAKVYDDPPTQETADIQFELSGAVASPGDQGVPVDFFITSNFEFSGYLGSIEFDTP
ncbi:MAG: hypothetical protein AAF517_08060, partial [Planctomycetota bacterium]